MAEKIVNNMPNVSIGADVIVGFPGETDNEFNKTVNFIKDLPYLIYMCSHILKEKTL